MIKQQKTAISPRIILVPKVPDPFFGRSAAFLRKWSTVFKHIEKQSPIKNRQPAVVLVGSGRQPGRNRPIGKNNPW